MGNAFIAQRNLRVVILIDPEEHILVAIMSDIKFITRTAVPVVIEVPS